jgi:hypothetical protein
MSATHFPDRTDYSGGGYKVSVASDGAIVVKAGDSLSKYSMAIYGDFKHLDVFARKQGGKMVPIQNVNLIRTGETLYHLGEEGGQCLDPLAPNLSFDPKTLDAFIKKNNIVSRSGWWALPPNPFGTLDPATQYDTIVVHHSGPKALGTPRLIQLSHFARGFADIGYHFVIDKAGVIYEGRRLIYKGSHVKNQNSGKVGVVLTGCFEPGAKTGGRVADVPTNAQLTSLRRIIRCLVQFSPGIYRLGGHLDFMRTDCPGQNLYPQLQGIRQATGLTKPASSLPPGPVIK